MTTKKTTKVRRVKAWAVVEVADGGTWWLLDEQTNQYLCAITETRKESVIVRDKDFKEDGLIVPVTITYSVPARKRTHDQIIPRDSERVAG